MRKTVRQSNIEVLALAGLRALKQRGQHGTEAIHGAAQIGGWQSENMFRSTARQARQRERTAGSLIVEIMARPQCAHSSLTIAAKRSVDQLGKALAERCIVQAQTFHHARPIGLQYNIGGLKQLLHLFEALCGFQIDLYVLLSPIDRVKQARSHQASVVTMRRALDLGHAGAHLHEVLGQEWARQKLREIQNADAL